MATQWGAREWICASTSGTTAARIPLMSIFRPMSEKTCAFLVLTAGGLSENITSTSFVARSNGSLARDARKLAGLANKIQHDNGG